MRLNINCPDAADMLEPRRPFPCVTPACPRKAGGLTIPQEPKAQPRALPVHQFGKRFA